MRMAASLLLQGLSARMQRDYLTLKKQLREKSVRSKWIKPYKAEFRARFGGEIARSRQFDVETGETSLSWGTSRFVG